jgi:hypothetical protein
VPCIDSAWTSLCKSENQKACSDAIDLYEKSMMKACFLPAKTKNSTTPTKIKNKIVECVSYNILKDKHKMYREEAENLFKA